MLQLQESASCLRSRPPSPPSSSFFCGDFKFVRFNLSFMASGSPAGRANSSGAKSGFDFASDDILCSYDDFANQEASNGIHSDSVIGSSKDFHKSKPRSSAYTTTDVYTQPDESVNQEVVVAVERTMKK